ncbi:MAG: histone deacetylase family protein [Candidatus Omnitrophica bacterium]|nr:histone deacetylase family protein [Candidatus Omnitrophota bacterium]
MNNVALIYSNDFKELDFGYGHPMRGDRYRKALEEFKKLDLLDNLTIKKPEMISEDIVSLFHTTDYIKKVREVSNSGGGFLGEEVPAFIGVYDIALLSVSASVTAANYIVDNSPFEVTINICGGWHHAFEDKGRGFCIFNDIAITANYFLKRKNIEKIMIIDYDAHHGDGTQWAFYNNSKVYTVSFHQDPATLYPFKSGYENETGVGEGKGFNRNFSLSALCNDTEFISKFNQVPKLIKDFAPEILILQMGVDGSKECSISSMQLTRDAYDYASKLLMDLQKKHKFKIMALGGGGFVHPMLGQHWGIQIQNFIEG